MLLVEEGQYEHLLSRYVDHAVAFVKKEQIFNRKTESHDAPSEQLMQDVESILGVSGGDPMRFRESLLARIAGYKIDNPKDKIEISKIFFDHLQRIKEHYYEQKSRLIEANMRAILVLGGEHERQFTEKQLGVARSTLKELESQFGYDGASAKECVKFLLMTKDQGPRP